jgi:hypothetical protein
LTVWNWPRPGVDREQLAEETARGAIQLPSAVSIARRLLEHWYGSVLPPSGTWR